MWQKNVRYLDYNASSGLTNYVQQKLIETLQSEVFFANPSSQHRLGQRVQHLLYLASQKVATSLGSGVTPDDLIFTSSGTEANQTVILSAIQSADGVIIGSGEHSASYDLAPEIQSQIPFTHLLKLQSDGQYDFSHLKDLLDEAKLMGLQQLFISLFWANNETGVVTDLAKLKAVIRESGLNILLHLDGAQVWGKLVLNVIQTPADFITFSSHKIGAPAGTGLIWKRPTRKLIPLIQGSQAHGLRGGTENTLGIIATGFAAEKLDALEFQERTAPLQAILEKNLSSVKIWGKTAVRVTNTTRLSYSNFQAYENWVELLDVNGFAVSHGSACKSKVIEPSRILLAMGGTKAEALNSIRISFGVQNTLDDVYGVMAALQKIYDQKMQNTPEVRA